jgi:hypothetical protein
MLQHCFVAKLFAAMLTYAPTLQLAQKPVAGFAMIQALGLSLLAVEYMVAQLVHVG